VQKALSAASTLCVYGDALADGKYLFDQSQWLRRYPFDLLTAAAAAVKCAMVYERMVCREIAVWKVPDLGCLEDIRRVAALRALSRAARHRDLLRRHHVVLACSECTCALNRVPKPLAATAEPKP
jgi:hypothetical protein